VIVTDESDLTGNEVTGGWESEGCCDSPFPAIIVTGIGPRHPVDHTPYSSLLTRS
jgi:hypothetical protein